MDGAPPNDVLAYYESGAELGRLETPIGRVELLRTQELLLRYLKPASDVLDVGGGTGIYASWLSSLGHRVRLLDVAELHVAEARRRSDGAFFADVGDARALPAADASYDAVLLLGPLYHLSERGDRLRALAEARRVCRTGGFIAAVAISRFAPMLDTLRTRRLDDDRVLANVAEEVSSGARVEPARRTGPFPDAHFHRPDELGDEVVEAGFALEGVFGIEGPGSLLGDLEARAADEVAWARVMWAARVVEQEPAVVGVSPHLLAVGRAI